MASTRRRRRRQGGGALESASQIVTVAAVAYSAYRLGSWALQSYGWGGVESKADGGDDDVRDYEEDVASSEDHHRFRHCEDDGGGDGDATSDRGRTQSSERKEECTAHHQHTALSHAARAARVERCRIETCNAMADFLPTLKKVIAKETKSSGETKELKVLRDQRLEALRDQMREVLEEEEEEGVEGGEKAMVIRERERELWNSIKNKSVTRLITTAYAHAILYLALTVQVNLLGGRLLREELLDEEEDKKNEKLSHADASSVSEDVSIDDNVQGGEAGRYRSSHRVVLAQTYHRFFAEGISSLTEEVRRAVEEALLGWDVAGGDGGATKTEEGARGNGGVSIDDVSTWMEAVRNGLERRRKDHGRRRSCLARFVVPSEDGVATDSGEDKGDDDDLARYILDETYDLLESPAFARAERDCLDETFALMYREGYGKLFNVPIAADGTDEGRIPLARIVTQLQKGAVVTFHTSSSSSRGTGGGGLEAELLPDGWEEMFGTMMGEQPARSFPNAYVERFENLESTLELGDVSFD